MGKSVITEVRQQCIHSFGHCPDIKVFYHKTTSKNFCYVPHHLRYMVAELLKNSCRATLSSHSMPPAIQVTICKGDEDVTIKVTDRGGGLSRSDLENVWKFTH